MRASVWCFLFVAVIVVTIGCNHSSNRFAMLRELKTLVASLRGVPLSDETVDLGSRLLRAETEADKRKQTPAFNNEERCGAFDIFRKLWTKFMMFVKRKLWLRRGEPPEKVMKKLNVRATSDKNYKYYSKYYFDYYIMYPTKQPPKHIANDIMNARLRHYLDNNFPPPQVFKELQLTGTFASARGQPNYKYFVQYRRMWSDLQVKVSKRDTILFEA